MLENTAIADMDHPCRIGVDNLLINCGEIGTGANVLFINEPSYWVERDIVEMMEERARQLNANVTSLWASRMSGPESVPAEIIRQIEVADVTIFNHSMGAMLRVFPIAGAGIRILNYATTRELMEADYARVNHKLWDEASKKAIQEINTVRRWHIKCDLGTDVEGVVPESESKGIKGLNPFALRTFPFGTHRPTSSMLARGKLAIRWLTSASMHDFGSQGIRLEEPIILEFSDAKIIGFTGNQKLIDRTVAYLEEVGNKTHKEAMLINSWHAGINPQTFSPWGDSNETLEAWMNVAHNSPHILHFHAIGEQIPGELSVPIIDPTVTMDDKVMWTGGKFTAFTRSDYIEMTKRYTNGERAFVDNPNIGI